MELFRIFKNKKFIAAAVLLLLLNCVSFYITQKKHIENNGVSINQYADIFHGASDILSETDNSTVSEKSNKFLVLKSFADAEKLKAENAEEYEWYAEEEARLISEHPELYQEYKNGGYSYEEIAALSEIYAHFAYQLEYQNGYSAYIDEIAEKGKSLSSKKLFSDENSFSYKSIQKTTDDFLQNKSLILSPVNDFSVSSVLNYQIGDFVLILLCVFLALTFSAEKNVNLLVNTCQNGRRWLKLKQIPIIISFSVFVSAAIYITELMIALKIYNAPLDWHTAVQSSDLFKDCVLHIDFLQFFAILILFKAIAAVMFSVAVWLLVSVSNNIVIISGIAGITAAVELLLYKNISLQSNVYFFRVFNIFSIFDYRSITEYSLVSCFSTPVRADIFMWAIIICIAVSLSLTAVLSAKRCYPVKTPKKVFGFMRILLKKAAVLYAQVQNVIYAGRFESFKIMHTGRGIFVAVAFLFVIGFSFNTNTLVFSSTELFLNDYYEQYGGELNSSVYDSVNRMHEENNQVQLEFDLKGEQYSAGAISFEEYEKARAKNAAYDTQRKAVDILEQQLERLQQIEEKGIKPVVMNELGYSNLFYSSSNQTEILSLLCAVIILFSSVFSIEKSSGMVMLNHCSKNGRNKLYLKKILAVLPKTFLLTCISYTVLIIQNAYLYKLNHFDADIHNLQCLQNINMNLSISEYIILNFLFEFLFITAAGLITASLSVFMSQITSIILSACVFVLPGALYMINISAAKELSSPYQFCFNSFVLDKGISADSFIFHFLLTAVCFLLLYLCRRKWCLTKDR